MNFELHLRMICANVVLCREYNPFRFGFCDFHRELKLRQPIYQSTSCYGHFGRDGFAWEEAKPLNLDCLNAKDGAAIAAPTPVITNGNGNGEHAEKKARYA